MADYEDVYAPDLAEETTSTLSGSEQFVMFDSVEGKRGSVNNVGSYILQNGDADGEGHTVAEMIEAAVPRMTKEVTGNPITVDDALGGVDSLTVDLEPIQTGTPSPSSPAPITGHDSVTVGVTGKNMLDPSKRKNSIINIWWGATLANDVPDGSFVLNAGTYTLSASDTMTGLYIVNTSKENIAFRYNATSLTFTLTKRTVVKVLLFKPDVTLDYMESVNVQLEVGSTASAYESYYGHSTTVTLPSTVYGGTVGVTSGTGTSNMIMVDLGDIGWAYNSNYGFITTALSNDIKSAPDYNIKGHIYCTVYPTGKYSEITNAVVDKQIGVSGGNYGYVVVRDTDYTDAASFKSAMSGVMLCYERKSSTTLTTTPTDITLYNGDNVVSSDGDMDMVYVRDIVKVIEKLEG